LLRTISAIPYIQLVKPVMIVTGLRYFWIGRVGYSLQLICRNGMSRMR